MEKKSKKYKCARCDQGFATRRKLSNHSKGHVDAWEEIKLLQQGHIPSETKLGSGFKGKNKIIIT